MSIITATPKNRPMLAAARLVVLPWESFPTRFIKMRAYKFMINNQESDAVFSFIKMKRRIILLNLVFGKGSYGD